MLNSEKNKWLTENVLGECWHKWTKELIDFNVMWTCPCGEVRYGEERDPIPGPNPDFYSSNEQEQAVNFFRLWRVIQRKEWFEDFLNNHIYIQTYDATDTYAKVFSLFINCSALADAIGEYFGWEEVK